MAKGDMSVDDLDLAPRKPRSATTVNSSTGEDDKVTKLPERKKQEPAEEPISSSDTVTERMRETDTERRERIQQQYDERERGRSSLVALKQKRRRESKHFVNVPLNWEDKQRIAKAAFENDLSQTEIAKAAIDKFLTENGY